MAASAGAPRIAGIDIRGGIDAPGALEAYLDSLAPRGSYFVEAGDADTVGDPVSTMGRLRQALGRLGYESTVAAAPELQGDVRVQVELRPLDRVRQIFVWGNGRVRQEEILRRISLRAGQVLPPAGSERDAAVDQERLRVLEYLRSEGYLEADATMELSGTGQQVPSPINIRVNITLGSGYPIGSITIAGNHIISTDKISSDLRHSDWLWLWTRPLPFRRSVLREDIAALTEKYRSLGYPGARILEDADAGGGVDRKTRRVRIGLQVNERKHIDLTFEGNDNRPASDLRAVLTILSKGSYSDYEATASAEAIARLYRENGYLLVEVRWRRERTSPDAERIVFTIAEGPELKVRTVEFAGNQAFSSRTLAEVVTVRPFPLLGLVGLGEGGYATPLQLELDSERLGEFFRSNGFPDAKATCDITPGIAFRAGAWRPVRDAFTDPKSRESWQRAKDLHIRFTVRQGPLVRVSQIRFDVHASGAPAPTLPRGEDFAREFLLTKTGAPYRPQLLRQDVDRLKRLLGDSGFPQATAEPIVTRQADAVDIVWQVRLGPQMRLGPIFVRGNFLTRQDTILQWIPLKTGSPLTTTGFERGQRNLALNQLFNNPNPISFPGATAADGTVPMLIEVEERHDHWGVIRLGGGASTDQVPPGGHFPLDGLYASAGYEHRNLFGRGWRFLSKTEIGNSLTRANVDFLEPRLWSSLFRLQLSGNYLRQTTARLGDLRSGGGAVGIAREMYPGIDAAVRYSLRNTLRTEALIRGAGADIDQNSVRIGTMVGSLIFSLDWLRLDNLLLPTRGFKFHGSVEVANPALSFDVGTDTFVKTHARSLVVVPLTRRLTLRHSVRYDQGFPLAGASLLPKVERFFSGGDTTVRGFELDRARAEVIQAETAPGVYSFQYHPLGGSLRILHNIDLQFPIAGVWYGAVFLDNGLLVDSFEGVRPGQFRHGAGFSPLLIRLPIGDISMSWAWPLDPQPGDSRIGRLHFNVGLMF